MEAARQYAEERKDWRALVNMKRIECDAANFACFPCSFGPPTRALEAYHLERVGMPLHDLVRINCKKSETTDIKEQVPSMWAKGCMLENYACII